LQKNHDTGLKNGQSFVHTYTKKDHDLQSLFTWYKGDDSSNNFYICGIQEYLMVITQN